MGGFQAGRTAGPDRWRLKSELPVSVKGGDWVLSPERDFVLCSVLYFVPAAGGQEPTGAGRRAGRKRRHT